MEVSKKNKFTFSTPAVILIQVDFVKRHCGSPLFQPSLYVFLLEIVEVALEYAKVVDSKQTW